MLCTYITSTIDHGTISYWVEMVTCIYMAAILYTGDVMKESALNWIHSNDHWVSGMLTITVLY